MPFQDVEEASFDQAMGYCVSVACKVARQIFKECHLFHNNQGIVWLLSPGTTGL
jgi:hypothetical protein